MNPTNRASSVTTYTKDKDGNINIEKSGSHEEVYGAPKTNQRGKAGQNAAKHGTMGSRANNRPKNESNLIESFEDFFEAYQSGLIESSNEEVDLNRRKFLLEQLYINKDK